MRLGTVLFVLSASLVACGPDLEQSCQDYFDAQIGCIEEAYADDPAMADAAKAAYPDTYCDAYADASGAAADDAADLFECYAAATDAADCSTTEGYTALSNELLACVGA